MVATLGSWSLMISSDSDKDTGPQGCNLRWGFTHFFSHVLTGAWLKNVPHTFELMVRGQKGHDSKGIPM